MRTDTEIDFLENYIPDLAESAIRKAYLDALSSGNSVLISSDGAIYEIFPDGKKVFVKNIEKNIKIDSSMNLVIKWNIKSLDWEFLQVQMEVVKAIIDKIN